MVRLLGVNRKKGRKRLITGASSSTTNINGMIDHATPSQYYNASSRDQHAHDMSPMYQYALNEYAQTVAAGTSNDAGKLSDSSSWSGGGYDDTMPPDASVPTQAAISQLMVPNVSTSSSDDSLKAHPPASPLNFQHSHSMGSTRSDTNIPINTAPATAVPPGTSDFGAPNKLPTLFLHPLRSPFEADIMPDATYEETYGEAYTGGPIKYVYPSGYQSMRPRSCPWKLSIVVCLLFTWLSVFIVGHCSDQVEATKYKNDKIDDDSVALQIRWCGSRPLYLMWVTSMLITGLAAAYCSVIGYIKVRDFAVGNMRSQPPGVVVSGKSDYYVRIDDANAAPGGGGTKPPAPPPSDVSSSSSTYNYRPSIYQSDGTPQFWGAHIYRPTQAAVAITSR